MNILKSSILAAPALALVTSLAWISPASSQDAGTPSDAGGTTMAQFIARQSARIMAADRDGDGRVSRAEFTAMAGSEHDPARRFDAIDANHDGYLDKDEIRSALEKRFRRMDSNGDGVLTPDERMASHRVHEQPTPASTSAASQP